MPGCNVVVVGAGAVGLATALQIQASLPGINVTVIAEKFGRATTSDGAGGIFLPTLQLIRGTDPQLVKRWCSDSWRFFTRLLRSTDAADAHAQMISGYMLYNDPHRPIPIYADIVYHFRNVTPDELKYYGNTHKYGWFTTTVIVEPRWYLPWMMTKFKANGGIVIQKKIHDLKELSGDYDLIVNCSGLGSRDLGDSKTYSIRGQMIRVVAPHVKHFVYNDIGHYIIPCSESVVLGGTKSTNDYHNQPRDNEKQKIWEEALSLVPALKGSRELWHWAGLRPHREPVRVDMEKVESSRGKLMIVHNYGHGGNGIALSWGCGRHATELVAQALGRTDVRSHDDVTDTILTHTSKL